MPEGSASPDTGPVSTCPRCNALIPILEQAPCCTLAVARGRLAGAGCLVDVSEKGLIPRLHVETSSSRVYRGREPGRFLTRKGAVFLLVGPLVLLAVVLAFALEGEDLPPLPAVLGVLLLALFVYLLVRWYWRSHND